MSKKKHKPIPPATYLPGVIRMPAELTGREIGEVLFALYWPRFEVKPVTPESLRYTLRAQRTLPFDIVPSGEVNVFGLDLSYRHALVVPQPPTLQYTLPSQRNNIEAEADEIARILSGTFTLLHEQQPPIPPEVT